MVDKQKKIAQIDNNADEYMTNLPINLYLSLLKRLRRSRRATCSAIWRQLSSVIGTYLSKTEERRARVAELRADDEQSAMLLRQYQARINNEEASKERLKQELANLQSERSSTISGLENELKAINGLYIKAKQTLKDDLRNDKLKLEFLTDTSYKTISYLERLSAKGETLLMLSEKCQKFVTDREKILKWLPARDSSSSESQPDKESEEIKEKSKGTKERASLKCKDTKYPRNFFFIENVGKKIHSHLAFLTLILAPPLEPQQQSIKSKPRPKTAISVSTLDTPTPEIKDVTTVDQVTLQMRSLEVSLPSTSSSASHEPKQRPSIVDKCLESLKSLEHFWEEHSKVEVDVMEIREEKRLLLRENKQLKEMLKAILEATAVVNTIPNHKTSTRLPRIAYSAPIRSTVF
nr:unnamed protein product [Callosobruchus chinensis]